MVDNKVISAKEYINSELQRERHSFILDDFHFNLPKNIMCEVFKEHYSNIFFFAGQVMGSKSNGERTGYYGIDLVEMVDEIGSYKLDFAMGYTIKELPLGENCSQLIHEFNTKYNREENLKTLLDE